MKYNVRVLKRIKYVRVYSVVKRLGRQPNFLTKLFMKAFTKNSKEEQMKM
jgi:hypothetical protein